MIIIIMMIIIITIIIIIMIIIIQGIFDLYTFMITLLSSWSPSLKHHYHYYHCF